MNQYASMTFWLFVMSCARVCTGQEVPLQSDHPLTVSITPSARATHACDILHIAVRVANRSDRRFTFPGALPTNETGGIHFQWRKAGGAWTELRLKGEGSRCPEPSRLPVLEPGAHYVASVFLLCDREYSPIWRYAERGDLRAVVHIGTKELARKLISPEISLEVADISAADRDVITAQMPEVYQIALAETHGWSESFRDSVQGSKTLGIASRIGPSALRDTLERAKLYSELFPSKDNAEEVKAVEGAVEQLKALSRSTSPPVRQMIRLNLGLYYYRARKLEAGDSILAEFNPLDPGTGLLRSMRHDAASRR